MDAAGLPFRAVIGRVLNHPVVSSSLDCKDQPITRWLVKTARLLRKEDLDARPRMLSKRCDCRNSFLHYAIVHSEFERAERGHFIRAVPREITHMQLIRRKHDRRRTDGQGAGRRSARVPLQQT